MTAGVTTAWSGAQLLVTIAMTRMGFGYTVTVILKSAKKALFPNRKIQSHLTLSRNREGPAMKNKELKNQLDDLHEQLVALDEKIMSFVANVKHLPQGLDRWDLEEWIITECHIDPKIIRTKPSWTKQDWLVSAIGLKDAARRYRGAGKLAEAVACETDAKVAEERAAWMAVNRDTYSFPDPDPSWS